MEFLRGFSSGGSHLALEVRRVAEDGGVVGVHADAVAEHLLLVVEVGVGAEVVGEVHLLVHWARAGGTRGGGAGAVREGRHWVEAGARVGIAEGGFGKKESCFVR